MTVTCRSEIDNLLKTCIRNLESMYEDAYGPDYMDKSSCAMTLDFLTSVKNTVNPPFMEEGSQGELYISDMLQERDEQLDALRVMLGALMMRLNALENTLTKNEGR